MKKIFLYILAGSLCFSACKKDDDGPEPYKEPEDIATQNNYDDQAIKKFMDENYLDVQGKIKPFSATDTADDHEKKLSELSPVTLPSGTIYIKRSGAQPSGTDAKDIKDTDIIKIMGTGIAYLAGDNNGTISFLPESNNITLLNTITGNVVPYIDPPYYYVKQSILKKGTGPASKAGYYQIPGFREALQKFQAFDLSSGAQYNLQGVIIVPSRAAFARNPHYPYLNMSYRNRTFIFNFQIYGRQDRPTDDIQDPNNQ